MYEINRSVITLIPQEPFWAWLQGLPDTFLDGLTLEDLQEEANAYLIAPCEDLDQAWEEVFNRLDSLFSAELADWCDELDEWPDLHPDIFAEWFDIRLAPVVTDLSIEALERVEFEAIDIKQDV